MVAKSNKTKIKSRLFLTLYNIIILSMVVNNHLSLFVLGSDDQGNLQKVLVLFRHGMRAPMNRYVFNDEPVEHTDFWPEGYGNLVKTGRQQLYTLGYELRKRYNYFLGPPSEKVNDDIQIVTTRVKRCYQSAEYILKGFFPNTKVDINYGLADFTHIISNITACHNFHKDLQNILVEEATSNELIHHLMLSVAPNIKSHKIKTIYDLYYVADYLKTKSSFTKEKPKWLSEDDYKKLLTFHQNSFQYLTHTQNMKRLYSGPLITDVLDRINKSVYQQEENSKFYLYSGHDVSLFSVLRTLGFNWTNIPDYGACIIIELRKYSANDWRIKVLFNEDYSMTKLRPLIIPNCETLCSVGKFVQIIDKYLINSHERENECKVF